jgi:hypothetical protein
MGIMCLVLGLLVVALPVMIVIVIVQSNRRLRPLPRDDDAPGRGE